jgi:hypothetical protein
MNPPSLSKKLEKIGVFTFKEVLLNGLSRTELEKLIQAEVIDRVSLGVYEVSSRAMDQESIFSAACKSRSS